MVVEGGCGSCVVVGQVVVGLVAAMVDCYPKWHLYHRFVMLSHRYSLDSRLLGYCWVVVMLLKWVIVMEW